MEMPSTKYILGTSLILSAISWIVIAQVPQKFTRDPCTSKSSCHECIQTPSCAWCSDPNFKGNARCFLPYRDSQQMCHDEFIINPDNIFYMLENLHLSSGILVDEPVTGRIVQVAPQRLKLKLRARDYYRVSMQYSQAQGYPVDLYYLMDLSVSTEDDKNKLYTLGNQLKNTMKNLTSDFRLGFGSFRLVKPCDNCTASYEFRHHMTLSNDTQTFSHMMTLLANVSKNLDAPEGGFDAVMQAIVCKESIGWREKARRLLVFASDASFHFTRNEKLGGITNPNDVQCNLSAKGIYKASYQEHPSIEQINLSVKKNFINVIFAVNKSNISNYEELARNIEGSSVGKLEGDSSNIVELIKDQYQKISSTVEMKHNASSDVSLKFYTRCMNSIGGLVNTNKCGNVKVGDLVNFKIDIEILDCPKDPADYFQTIRIYPVGVDESLIIDLEMICECDCEKPGHESYEVNSPSCFYHGTFKCGICECESDAFGQKCECISEQTYQTNGAISTCVHPQNPKSPECSGRGQCICGVCHCNSRSNSYEVISGQYCECDNFSCERHDGKLCSDHGTCECGTCRCREQWTGPSCACTQSQANCYPPNSGNARICSGHGVCECGHCVCDNSVEGRYRGKFCEICLFCPDRCTEFTQCVQCQQYKTGRLTQEECLKNCTSFTIIPVKKTIVDKEKNEMECVFVDEDDCRFSYIYYYDEENKLKIRAQEERECPEKEQLPAVVLVAISAVVLIGAGMMLLLLWKVFSKITYFL